MARKLIQSFGFDVKCRNPLPSDLSLLGLDAGNKDILDTNNSVRPYTMTGTERLFALIQATEYVIRVNISGSIVECRVWRGGSIMAVARTLTRFGREDVDLFCFDTFEGMSKPTDVDVSYTGASAPVKFTRTRLSERQSDCAMDRSRKSSETSRAQDMTRRSYLRQRKGRRHTAGRGTARDLNLEVGHRLV